jgi:hypothetical protein
VSNEQVTADPGAAADGGRDTDFSGYHGSARGRPFVPTAMRLEDSCAAGRII